MTNNEIFLGMKKSLEAMKRDWLPFNNDRCYSWEITIQFCTDDELNKFYTTVTEIPTNYTCLAQVNISTDLYHIHDSISNLKDTFDLINKCNGIVVNGSTHISKKDLESIVVSIEHSDGKFGISTELGRSNILAQ